MNAREFDLKEVSKNKKNRTLKVRLYSILFFMEEIILPQPLQTLL